MPLHRVEGADRQPLDALVVEEALEVDVRAAIAGRAKAAALEVGERAIGGATDTLHVVRDGVAVPARRLGCILPRRHPVDSGAPALPHARGHACVVRVGTAACVGTRRPLARAAVSRAGERQEQAPCKPEGDESTRRMFIYGERRDGRPFASHVRQLPPDADWYPRRNHSDRCLDVPCAPAEPGRVPG